MVVGDYTFVLKVTDTGGQTASSSVTVVVQPEKNAPPVAVAGSDKVRKDVLWSLWICLIQDFKNVASNNWQKSLSTAMHFMTGTGYSSGLFTRFFKKIAQSVAFSNNGQSLFATYLLGIMVVVFINLDWIFVL